MIKSGLKLIPAILLVPLLASCAGVPPRPSSPDDCLVAIKTEFIADARVGLTAQAARDYRYELSGGYPDALVRRDYTLLLVREPAVRLRALGTRIIAHNFRGPPGEYPLDLVLPYDPGSIAVADFVFVNKVTSAGGEEFVSTWSFRQIGDGERAELLGELKSDPDLASWRKPESERR